MGYFNQSEEELWQMTFALFPSVKRANTMWVVGAHRFSEQDFLSRNFSCLDSLVLFEPIPDLAKELKERMAPLPWVKVIDKALSNVDGVKTLELTSNDYASASIFPMHRHSSFFPKIKVVDTIDVEVRKVSTILEVENLECPKILIMDTQGAEGNILQGIPQELLSSKVLLIYTEASWCQIYEDQYDLPSITREFLYESHRLVAYSPIVPEVPEHGNAVFINKQVY